MLGLWTAKANLQPNLVDARQVQGFPKLFSPLRSKPNHQTTSLKLCISAGWETVKENQTKFRRSKPPKTSDPKNQGLKPSKSSIIHENTTPTQRTPLIWSPAPTAGTKDRCHLVLWLDGLTLLMQVLWRNAALKSVYNSWTCFGSSSCTSSNENCRIQDTEVGFVDSNKSQPSFHQMSLEALLL